MKALEWKNAKSAKARKELSQKTGVMWSVLYELPDIDLPRIVLFDIMHQVFLGVTLSFMERLFHKNFAGKRGSLYDNKKKLKDLEKRMQAVSDKLPSNIAIIKKTFYMFTKNLTAAEIRVFLFVYSCTVLKGIVDDDVYAVWTYMLFAFSVFSARTLKHEDIDKAQKWYAFFLTDYAKLFGNEAIKPNFHFVEHMKEMLEDYGPLSSLSCWVWERFNKLHKEINTNKRDVERQMMRDYVLRQSVWDVVSGLNEGIWATALCKPVIGVLSYLIEGEGSYKDSVYSFTTRIPLVLSSHKRSLELRGKSSSLTLSQDQLAKLNDAVREVYGEDADAMMALGPKCWKRMMIDGKQVCAKNWKNGDESVVRALMMRNSDNQMFVGVVNHVVLVPVMGDGVGAVFVCVEWRKEVTDAEWEEHKQYPGILVSDRCDGEPKWCSVCDIVCPVLTLAASKKVHYVVCLQ